MTDTDLLACVGLDWTDTDAPSLRVASIGRSDPARSAPLLDTVLTYRADSSRGRYCCGWYDLSGTTPRHVVCSAWTQLSKGRQCRACQYEEGFLTAHQSHRGGTGMPAKVRAWLDQPHWLYLDIFADATIKVGTVADARRGTRLAEQGPVAAFYVARADNGTDIRKVESLISTEHKLPQAVQSGRKLRALQTPVDHQQLSQTLAEFVDHVRPYLEDIADRYEWITPIDPQPWEPASYATAVFDAAPVAPYPASLSEGSHRLHIRGVSGPIALITTDEADDAQQYAAELSKLTGYAIALGAHNADDAPAIQSSLF